MTKFLLIIPLILTTVITKAQVFKNQTLFEIETSARKGKWWTEVDDEGILLQYRWLHFSDSLKTRELSLSFVSDLDKELILKFLRFSKQVKEWNTSIKRIENYKDEVSTWISHTIYKIPFPLSKIYWHKIK